MKAFWPFTLGIALCLAADSGFGQVTNTIFANDDVFVETSTDLLTTTTYDGHSFSSQINFGLAAANGVASGRRRSYLEFSLGADTAISAKLLLYNYWGANMGGGGNPAASGQIRLRGTAVGTPTTFTEPATTLDTTFVPPLEANFATILTTATGAITNVGWYEFDITSWYNGRLGQTTSLMLRGVQTGGFDFPIFEDREGTAFLNGANNSLVNAYPRLIVVVPEPSTLVLATLGLGFLAITRLRKTSR